MTDLSRLFDTPLVSHLPTQPRKQTRSKPQTFTLKTKSSPWSIQSVESSLKKNIRESMEQKNLGKELSVFCSQQKKQAISITILFSIIVYLICYGLDLDDRVIFHLFLLFSTHLIPSLAFKITQEPVIFKSLHCIRPIIYAATSYYILKVLAGASIHQLNFPLTLLAITATSARMTLQYFEAVFFIEIEHLSNIQLRERSFLKRFSLFLLFCWQRVKFVIKMKEFLLFSTLTTFSLGILASLACKWDVFPIFNPINIVYYTLAFAILEVFLEFSRTLTRLFPEELKGVKDKMPIVLTLLRLSSKNTFAQYVHRRCLESLLLKMYKTHCFLSNETCKSLIFAKYMDILHFYAIQELQNLHEKVTSELLKMERDQRTFKKEKKIVEDIFIPFRRAQAFASQVNQMRLMLNKLSEIQPLLNVIFLADEQAFSQKDETRISHRTCQLIEMLVSKLSQVQRCTIKRGLLSCQLQQCQRDFSGKLFSMRQGWI